jgi:hypothetical protein
MLHAVEPRKQTVSLPMEMPGSAALQAVLEKALSRDRNQRFASALDFASALEAIERTLPEPRDMPTMAMPIDGDETMRVISSKVDTLQRDVTPPGKNTGTQPDTLHRETIRTQSPSDPPPAPAPLTLLTPLPGDSATIAPPAKMKAGLNPAYIVAFVALVILAIAVLLMLPGDKNWGSIVGFNETTTTAAPVTTTTATATQPPPKIAEASVTVTSGTSDSTQLSAPAVTTTTAIATTTTVAPIITPIQTTTVAQVTPPKPKPQPKPRDLQPVEPKTPSENAEGEEEETAPDSSVSAFDSGAKYEDGGDSDRNDRAMAILRRELRGTTTVALRAGGMTAELTRALRERFPNIRFAAVAPVVIRFNGRTDRLGAGRRRRHATAVIEKNGRVIFRYELPDEVYRVGQGSVEAFANVLGEAFED